MNLCACATWRRPRRGRTFAITQTRAKCRNLDTTMSAFCYRTSSGWPDPGGVPCPVTQAAHRSSSHGLDGRRSRGHRRPPEHRSTLHGSTGDVRRRSDQHTCDRPDRPRPDRNPRPPTATDTGTDADHVATSRHRQRACPRLRAIGPRRPYLDPRSRITPLLPERRSRHPVLRRQPPLDRDPQDLGHLRSHCGAHRRRHVGHVTNELERSSFERTSRGTADRRPFAATTTGRLKSPPATPSGDARAVTRATSCPARRVPSPLSTRPISWARIAP